MLISVAICSYQRYDRLRDGIRSLCAQTLAPAAFEILVIDNSPDTERSHREAAAFASVANLRWLHTAPPGLARARNHAIAEAAAPLLAFIDDDVQAPPTWLAAVVAGFDVFGAAVHCVGGPVRPDWAAPRPAWLADGLLPFLSLVDHGSDRRLLDPSEWVAGANVAYRRDRLRDAGGFALALGRAGPDAILLSNEETELAERLRAAGGQTAWLPEAGVLHHIAADRLDPVWFRRRAAWQAVSDFMTRPEHAQANFAAPWREVAGYLDHMGNHEDCGPALHALARSHSRPDLAHWEVTAVYHLVLCLLGGLQEPDPEELRSNPSP